MDNDILRKKAYKKRINYECKCCGVNTLKKDNYDRHILTRKHQNAFLLLQNADKKEQLFECKSCKFISDKKYDFDRHLLTLKHKKRILAPKRAKKEHYDNTTDFNKCSNLNENYDKEKFINYIINENNNIKRENNEIKIMMMDIIKNNSQIMNTINNSNITNNTIIKNKTFNLQFFLNETCKDAMNISDFIKTIQIPLSDLEKVGKVGYVNGITNIIVNNLNALDITKRPVHCSDVKREIIYVKDNGVWEKETEDNNKMRNVIKHVSYKNIGRIRNWRSIHPDYNETSSITSDIYQQIISGSNDVGRVSTDDSENKIIKKVIKEFVINKNII